MAVVFLNKKPKNFFQSKAILVSAGVDIADKFPLAKEFPTLGDFFTSIVRFALIAAALVFLALLVWGGIRYLNAGGNQDNVERARATLTSAGIGLLIVVLSLVIIEIITNVAGVESIF